MDRKPRACPACPDLVILSCVLQVLAFVFVADASELHQTCPPSYPSTNGTHEIFRGQNVVWQIPPSPKSVLFLAHGTDQEALMFFDRGPGCEQCYGLPESRVAVLDALREGYAVLTLQSIGARFQTWPLVSDDLENAVQLVKSWTRRHSLEHLPLVAWGFSNGGWFVSSLALRLPIRSLILLCSQGESNSLDMASPLRFPPTFFAHMNNTPADSEETFANVVDIAVAMATLADRGVPVFSTTVFPKPVTPELFLDRISCITEDMAESACEALRAGSWLDCDNYLAHDPRVEDWRAVMVEWNGLPYCDCFGDLCLAAQVQEELKVASGKHAFTSDANAEIFAWLSSADSEGFASPAGSPASGIFSV